MADLDPSGLAPPWPARRFDDLLSLVIPSRVLDPLIVNTYNVDAYLQEELIDLQSNEEIKARMKKGYEYFWLHEEIAAPYPGQQ
uniref:Uncharacterized protein n=1 Tax=Trichuris muris TaxID=70415 RepID=A0A5S6R0F2_TRIMR